MLLKRARTRQNSGYNAVPSGSLRAPPVRCGLEAPRFTAERARTRLRRHAAAPGPGPGAPGSGGAPGGCTGSGLQAPARSRGAAGAQHGSARALSPSRCPGSAGQKLPARRVEIKCTRQGRDGPTSARQCRSLQPSPATPLPRILKARGEGGGGRGMGGARMPCRRRDRGDGPPSSCAIARLRGSPDSEEDILGCSRVEIALGLAAERAEVDLIHVAGEG